MCYILEQMCSIIIGAKPGVMLYFLRPEDVQNRSETLDEAENICRNIDCSNVNYIKEEINVIVIPCLNSLRQLLSTLFRALKCTEICHYWK